MALITIPKQKVAQSRRAPDEVLGVVSAPSPRGSTYYSRMLRCPREHALATVVHLRTVGDNEALSQGFLFHHALETYYRSLQAQQRAAFGEDFVEARVAQIMGGVMSMVSHAYSEAVKSLEPFATEPGYDEMYPALLKMLQAYRDNYAEDPWWIVGIEETLIADDPEYSARLDLVVINMAENRLYVVEHKTARAFTDDLLAGYQMNLQILGQQWLMQRCVDLTAYPPFGGIIVNLVSKHKATQVQRVPVYASAAHLAAFEHALRAHEVTAELQRALGYQPDFTKCAGAMRGFRKCDYYTLCYTRPTLDVAALAVEDAPLGYTRRTEVPPADVDE